MKHLIYVSIVCMAVWGMNTGTAVGGNATPSTPDVPGMEPAAEGATCSGICSPYCAIACEDDEGNQDFCEVSCDTSYECASCYCWRGHAYCQCRPRLSAGAEAQVCYVSDVEFEVAEDSVVLEASSMPLADPESVVGAVHTTETTINPVELGICSPYCARTCEDDEGNPDFCEVNCDTSHECAVCYCWLDGHAYCHCRPKLANGTAVAEVSYVTETDALLGKDPLPPGGDESVPEPEQPAEPGGLGLCAPYCARTCEDDEGNQDFCEVTCDTDHECAVCYCWRGYSYCHCRPRLSDGAEAEASEVTSISATESVSGVAIEEQYVCVAEPVEMPGEIEATEQQAAPAGLGICAPYCARACEDDEGNQDFCEISCNTEYACAVCYCWFDGHAFCSCRPRFSSGSTTSQASYVIDSAPAQNP